ncbi:MAG TPA: sigma-70 family RNA polymerase sigma factor [Candidatus Dormibacteraeota bacterium]|nr:sigma-70 family RNA polymerase sigma factor [Candidatus Dormibacteraeota bacterium]
MSEPDVVARPGAGPDADRIDRETMNRLAGGDLGALDQLYEQYGAMAFSIALRITGDRAAAEDVVQESFLGAWRNAARYVDGRGTVRTWLLSIVHHRAIDAIRRRRPTSELPDAESGLPEPLVVPDTWAAVSDGLDRAAIQAALGRISEVQREAIELAYFNGLTQTEIAERTGVPLGTVKGRLRLGLQGLRAAMLAIGVDRG